MLTTEPVDGVTLKGTRHGLLLCVREDLEFARVVEQISDKVDSNSEFLGGAQVSLDLGWRELDQPSFEQLRSVLQARQIELAGVLSTSLQTRTVAEGLGIKAIIGRLGLAHHQGRVLRQAQRQAQQEAEEAAAAAAAAQAEAGAEVVASEPAVVSPAVPEPAGEREQEATLYIKRTLRSGQKAVYPGHIVLWGDLNPGAELEADGDVVVLGTVRGRIHAGANGNTAASVWCQALHPTLVRIADAMWSGDPAEAGVKLPAGVKITCAKDKLRFDPTGGK
jgi:septum site-determining protein MinC